MVQVADSIDQAIEEIVAAATNRAHPSDVQDAYARISERMARGSYSLVCRELFRRAAEEPDLYDTIAIDRAIQTFQSSLDATGRAVARGFENYVNQSVRQWLRDTLKQSLKEPRTNRPSDTSTDEPNWGTLSEPEGQTAPLPSTPPAAAESSRCEPVTAPVGSAGPCGEAASPALVDLGSPGALNADGEESTVYEGTVKVRVKEAGGVKNTLSFLNKLRAHPYLRVFNMTGEGDDVVISLALRQQTRLEQVLSKIPCVSNVTVRGAEESGLSEQVLEVSLKGGPEISQVA